MDHTQLMIMIKEEREKRKRKERASDAAFFPFLFLFQSFNSGVAKNFEFGLLHQLLNHSKQTANLSAVIFILLSELAD